MRICLNVHLFSFILLALSECFWSYSSSFLLRVVFLYCVFIIAFSSMVFGLPLELLLFTIRLSRMALWFFFFFSFRNSISFYFSPGQCVKLSLAFPDNKFVLQKGLFYFLLPQLKFKSCLKNFPVSFCSVYVLHSVSYKNTVTTQTWFILEMWSYCNVSK